MVRNDKNNTFFGEGQTLKYLGVSVDAKLSMIHEIHRIRMRAKPKLKAILRTKLLYNETNLIAQFKAHALPILEGLNGAICHAFNSHLNKLDMLQCNFIRELGVSSETAFLQHNLAPLKLRRDIGMLGLLFQIRCGFAHPGFSVFFPPAEPHRICTRAGRIVHSLQIQDFRRHPQRLDESIVVLCCAYVEPIATAFCRGFRERISASIDRSGACSVPSAQPHLGRDMGQQTMRSEIFLCGL